MVAMNSFDGLIVTTRAEASGQLAELSAACGWPTLWAASARGMLRELSLQIPSCVLFWLDDWESVAKTVRLIEWLRERNAKPYRIAIACDLGDGAEAVLRAAGAHSVLPVAGQSGDAIARALWPLLRSTTSFSATTAVNSIVPNTSDDRVPQAQLYPSDLVRPP
jgi:hypothetical protein